MRPVHRDQPARLGAAVAVEQRDTEQGLELHAQRRRARRPRGEASGERAGGNLARARDFQKMVVHGGNTAHERVVVAFQRGQHLIGREPVENAGGGTDGGDADNAQHVRQGVVQRQGPQHLVVVVETDDRGVAGGDRPQAGALRRQHALRFAGGAGGVEHERHVVQALVVARGHGRVPRHQILVRDNGVAARERPVAADHHLQIGAAGQQGADLVEVREVGDHDTGAAVVQHVGELGVGGMRVERHRDRVRARHGEVALDDVDAVAEEDQRPVTRLQPQVREVAAEPPGALLQFRVRDRAPRVRERDLLRGVRRVVSQQVGQRPDQFGSKHPDGAPYLLATWLAPRAMLASASSRR